jgi:hypothetical protein
MRGRSANPPHFRDRQQQPRYGPRDDPRFMRNGYRGDRHTVDRERFPKYHHEREMDDFCDDDDVEQQAPMTRRDRMRERERDRSPPQNRQFMRYSEDRQMGGSPRYARGGRKLN